MKLDFARHIFQEYSDIKFKDNPSSGGGVSFYMRMDGWTDGQAGMMKLIDAFRKFANAPKNGERLCFSEFFRCVIMVRVCPSCQVEKNVLTAFRLG